MLIGSRTLGDMLSHSCVQLFPRKHIVNHTVRFQKAISPSQYLSAVLRFCAEVDHGFEQRVKRSRHKGPVPVLCIATVTLHKEGANLQETWNLGNTLIKRLMLSGVSLVYCCVLGAYQGVAVCGCSPEVRCPAAYGGSVAWEKA